MRRAAIGSLLLDVPNRGRKVALGMFNSAVRVPDPDGGRGLRQRLSDAARLDRRLDRLAARRAAPRTASWRFDVPRAAGVSGLVRCEFRPNTPVDVLPLADRYHMPVRRGGAGRSNRAPARARARRRPGDGAAAARLALRAPGGRAARRRTPRHVHLEGGFVPGDIYDLVYRANDPPVVGLAFLAVRDTGAFLHWGRRPHRATRARARSTARTSSACRRADASCAICSTSVSTRTSRAGWSSTRCVPHVAGGRARRVQPAFRPALGQRTGGGRQPVPVHRRDADRSGHRPARRLAGAHCAAWAPAHDLRDQHVGRVLARRRLADPHRRRPAGATSSRRPRRGVYLFAGTQHTPGALPPPDADPNTGVARPPAVQRGGLRAAAARGAGEPRPLGERRASSRRRACSRAWPTATRSPAESTAATFRAIPGVRFPDRVTRVVRLDFGPEMAAGSPTELPPKSGAAVRRLRSRRWTGRQRDWPGFVRSSCCAAGDRDRLESAASRAGRARRPDGDDGLDAALRADRSGAAAPARCARLDRGALCARGRRT